MTHTSRAPREGDDGVHYHFRSAEKLRESAGKPGVFVEWVEAYGNFYGTSRYAVEAVARTGRSAILDLNVEGARQVADNKLVGPRASFIYVVPPSADALEGRMRASAEMSEEAIAQRIAAAREELAAGAELVEILGGAPPSSTTSSPTHTPPCAPPPPTAGRCGCRRRSPSARSRSWGRWRTATRSRTSR